MFSSWDLVRPRFWYPMSSLEQSMMELEHMNDLMMRPRFPFDVQREAPVMATYVEDESDSDSDSDDDYFFVDLPVVARKCMPTAFQPQVVPEVEAEEDEEEKSMSIAKRKTVAAAHDKSDADSSTDMEVDDDSTSKTIDAQGGSSSTKSKSELAATATKDKIKKAKHHSNYKKRNNKQLRKRSYKVTPTTERKITPNKTNDAAKRHAFSSYSFSNSSVVDDKGRRVTTTRRYEDSTGRLKAVHEREIDGKTLRTTWGRQNKEDEGRHESICSSGSPEEFEALWQQTPFGEAQKKSVKGQLQSESDGGHDRGSVEGHQHGRRSGKGCASEEK